MWESWHFPMGDGSLVLVLPRNDGKENCLPVNNKLMLKVGVKPVNKLHCSKKIQGNINSDMDKAPILMQNCCRITTYLGAMLESYNRLTTLI